LADEDDAGMRLMKSTWRNCRLAAVILLASAEGALAQDLSPTSFLQRTVTPAGVGKPLGFQASLGVSTEYNSNVNLSDDAGSIGTGGLSNSETTFSSQSQGGKADFITEADLNLSGVWYLTRASQLTLGVDVGYQTYINHSDLDGVTMNIPSAFQYSFVTGDFKWTLHDSILVSNDPAGNAELSGVDKFGELTNDAGLDVAFASGDKVTLTVGYERYDYFSTSSTALAPSGPQDVTASNASDQLDHASNSINLGAIYNIAPSAQLGLGTSMTTTSYSGSTHGDSTAYSAGPFFNAALTPATKVFLSGGFQEISGDGGGGNWYGTLQITNQLNPIYSQTLEASHTVGLGLISDTFALDSIRYDGNLQLRRDLSLSGDLFFEHGDEMGSGIDEKLDRYGANLTFHIQLTKSLQGTIGWEFLVKNSDIAGRSYQQQRVFSSLSWTF
jgi:hypothetical protein